MRRHKPLSFVIALLFFVGIFSVLTNGEQAEPTADTGLNRFFREFAELTDDQIKSIQSGNAIAKIMKSPPEQILIFGAVFVKANPQAYLDFATTENLRKLPGYLAIKEFSDPHKFQI